MTRVVLAIAALIAASALFAHVLPPAVAQPTGPVVTGGSHPWVDGFGLTAVSTTDVMYTVPADRIFVMTTLSSTNGAGFLLKENGSQKLNSSVAVMMTALSSGNGHMTFQPGSEVQFTNSGSGNSFYWYFEGYLAHP